ncbi:hypothetical protein [Streptomyces sp. NPDC046925]|uniref:hypothetical protein n=1 Tax=Streptomyces sp. NPDC046925 TaxID=3155375 RepID=UPI0033E0B151
MSQRYETSPPDCPLTLLSPGMPDQGHGYEPGEGSHALIIDNPYATAHVIEGPLDEIRDFARRITELTGPAAQEPAAGPDAPSVWVLQWWDKHDDHLKLFADEEGALAHLAKGVRGDWSAITAYEGVPGVPPADDREAVEIYYGPDGNSPFHDDDGYELVPTTVHRA